jgi:hypothetical protein
MGEWVHVNGADILKSVASAEE